ncbi:hypothetical protein WMY93_000971 [Mugilogobius chulae]|uniref:Protein tyrosine phosphatase, receptor type, f, b n=1 Tax=Mugilogobius chulae TaxID=88201 RepID=A0AAW0Q905_9GOBI
MNSLIIIIFFFIIISSSSSSSSSSVMGPKTQRRVPKHIHLKPRQLHPLLHLLLHCPGIASPAICGPYKHVAEDQIPHGFPTIDMGPQLRVVEKTRTATMLCAASGNPDPEISWYKDMLPVDINSSNGRIKQLRSGALQIENSEESDQGKYECVAMNSAGTRYSAPANLYVRDTATSVTLTWDSGNPEPVSYYMIQYKAKSSDNGFQEVEGVAPLATYEFRVMAVNNIGRGPPSDPVETRTGEQAPSSPPLHVQARMLSASTMLVQWEPPEEPNGQIRGYRRWQKHNTDDSSLTTISGLIPDITYSLRVLGFTSVGDGPPSDILQVKTQQGVPAQPSSFEAEAEQDDRIMLTWLWPVQDPISKYELQYGEVGSEIWPLRPPQNVHLLSLSSTSLKVSWVAPPAASRHGAIVRYTVSYQALTGDDTERHEVAGSGRTPVATSWRVWRSGLSIRCGSGLTRIARSAPRKLEVEALNSTAIRVTWKPPLQQKQHGQIRGYQVIFSRLENGEPRGQPNIMDVALPEAQWNIDESTEHEAVIGGLHSETTYSVTVAAYTTKGDGARSKAKVITTTGAVPGKPTMMISTTMGNTALIQWQPPKEMVGELMGYQLQFKRTDDEHFTSRELKGKDDHFTVTGLHKGANYIFRLSARNRAGIGEAYTKEISTPEDVPSGFPINLQVTGLTQNGKIVYYMVVYRDINSQQNSTNKTTENYMTIQGLSPDTTYDIRVQAYTSKGAGPLSPSIQSRTMSNDFPTLNFGVKAVMKTSVLLTWDLPPNYKSQVPFKILYNQQSVEVEGNLKRKLITALQPDTDYSFVLTSRGNIAGGLQQQVSIRTAPDLIKTQPINKQQAEGGKMTIILPKVQTNTHIRWYYIVVVPVSQSSRRWKSPDEMDLDEMTFSASPYSELIQVTQSRVTAGMEKPEMLWVMGPVLAVVLIIIIVIAILLFKKKRASPLPKDDHSGGVKDSLLANSSDPVEMRRLNYQTPGPSSNRCPNTQRMREHPPITVADLADHIERLKANDGLKFSQEYESIDPGSSLPGRTPTWK